MSRFDSNFDDMEEKYIYEKIDDDDNNKLYCHKQDFYF